MCAVVVKNARFLTRRLGMFHVGWNTCSRISTRTVDLQHLTIRIFRSFIASSFGTIQFLLEFLESHSGAVLQILITLKSIEYQNRRI